MNLVSYFNSDSLEPDNDGLLGLLTETITQGLQFFPIDSEEFDIWVNGYHGIKSFSLSVDNGTCTFSKEFRKSGDRIKGYWYASKKVEGKLKKLYFGTAFTKEKLNQIVDRLLVRDDSDNSSFELAGDGKDARHIQTSLVELANDETKILKHRNNELERQNKDLNTRLIETLDEVAILKKLLAERDNELFKTHEKLLERSHTIDMQAALIMSLEKDVVNFRDEAATYHNQLEQLQWDASNREDDVAGYAFMYQQNSDRIFAYQSLIEKYRAMTIDKTKKGNPRYAYLIDFLADIDKIC